MAAAIEGLGLGGWKECLYVLRDKHPTGVHFLVSSLSFLAFEIILTYYKNQFTRNGRQEQSSLRRAIHTPHKHGGAPRRRGYTK